MKFTERSTVFTDDDLKRLKECINKSEGRLYIARTSCEDEFDMPALLARLEAAEAYALDLEEFCAELIPKNDLAQKRIDELNKSSKAWCESKGL